MRVLVGCEISGVVRDAFIRRGHQAWSNNLAGRQPQGEFSEFHLFGDLRHYLAGAPDGQPWDLLICHPPCTYLTASAEWAYKDPPYHQRVGPGVLTGAERRKARKDALQFVWDLWLSGIDRICIENPVGVLSQRLREPDQVIQPWQFGHDASKKTCLWLKRLRKLKPTRTVKPRVVDGRRRWANQTDSGQNRLRPGKSRAVERSKTYEGIAEAMATQWG